MPYHDPDDYEPGDDDGWTDDDDELADDVASQCPECGRPVYSFSDKCPACGYWLSASDRRAMWPNMHKPLWLRVTAWIVLAAFVFTLLAVGLTIF